MKRIFRLSWRATETNDRSKGLPAEALAKATRSPAQRLGRQLPEMFSVVGRELAHVPEAPSVGNVSDACIASHRPQLSMHAGQAPDMKVPFGPDSEFFLETPVESRRADTSLPAEFENR